MTVNSTSDRGPDAIDRCRASGGEELEIVAESLAHLRLRRVEPNRSEANWSVRLIRELDAVERWTNAVTRGLSPRQLNWRPTEEVWSIGQCFQHLLVSNEVYLPAIANALDGRSPAPVEDIIVGWFGRWFIRTYIDSPPESKRLRAPEKITPGPTVDASVVDRFRRSNDVARALVRRASAYDVNHIRFRNPFVPLLHFTVGTGLEIVWRHQRRHLRQAERIRRADRCPQQ